MVNKDTPTFFQESEQAISFSRDNHWRDFDEPGHYPIIVSPIVRSSLLHKVLIDEGSGINKTHDPEYMEFQGAMQDNRVPQHCIMDFVSETEMHGGPENVPVTAQDIKNMRAAKGREKNSNDLDKERKLFSIFLCYANQQGEYINFGDVITFDTTHKANLYDKPLGMFVCAIHHLKCTVFGFGLLGDETVETFEWVFNAFKTCMGAEVPRVMQTRMICIHAICNRLISINVQRMFNNKDPAMPVTLRRVFLNTVHKLCLWHVQNKFMPFLNNLYARFEEEGFKSRNGSLLFSKPDYCGLMVSTRRSESMNKLVKSAHVDANTPLHEFLSK
ncbi:hypothetical protein U9M48_037036 [Paspalum notatum var. saurae]|uniref:MULE transposase domain-containing protein n=1 Tax=Paspalum notatum var. saurae TaxID=547442 RepID=A0AAQ3UEU4_PASNO